MKEQYEIQKISSDPGKRLTEIVKMMIRGQSQNDSQTAAFRELPVQTGAG